MTIYNIKYCSIFYANVSHFQYKTFRQKTFILTTFKTYRLLQPNLGVTTSKVVDTRYHFKSKCHP